jgi:hypothetical protein
MVYFQEDCLIGVSIKLLFFSAMPFLMINFYLILLLPH